MNRDEAVRVVAEAMSWERHGVRYCDDDAMQCMCGWDADGRPDALALHREHVATTAVEALTRAGWGDLAAVPAIATPREMEALRTMEQAVGRAERAEAEVERLRGSVAVLDGLNRTMAAERNEARAAIARVEAIDPADHATTSRDYGRGYAQAIRDIRAALRG